MIIELNDDKSYGGPVHVAIRAHSEGNGTCLILGERGLRDVFLEKVRFQLSPEGWLWGSQVKEKEEGRTFWAENEVMLFFFNQDLSYFNPQEWSNVGCFQICGRLLELREGGILRQRYVLFSLPGIFPCKWLMMSSADFIQWIFYSHQTLEVKAGRKLWGHHGFRDWKKIAFRVSAVTDW